MLVLFETAAGFALFKAKDGKLRDEDMSSLFATPELAADMVFWKNIYFRPLSKYGNINYSFSWGMSCGSPTSYLSV